MHQKGRFLFVNAAALVLYRVREAGDITGRPVLELVPKDYRAFVAERMRLSYEERVPVPRRESKVIALDGTLVDVEVTSTPVTARGGPATLAIMRDITGRKLAREALRENQERLSALNANLADGMVYQISSGPDGRDRQFTYVSPAVEKFHGLTVQALQEEPRLLYEQMLEEDRMRITEQEERAFASKTKMEADVRVRTPSGEVRWRRFTSSPRRTRDGNWLWDGIELDITERRRAEETLERYRTELERHVHRRTVQLQEAYERLKGIVESITDGFFVMDADWRITYVNSQATRIWGIASENLIGRTCWEIAPLAVGTVYEAQCRLAMKDRVPVVFEAVSPITGTWTEVRAHPSEGGLSVYFHDITARRERDAERTRLASAIEAAAEGILITDRKGIIQYVNPAFREITGYTREDIGGRSTHFLDSGRHDDSFYRAIREALRNSGVWRGRKVSRKKDGSLYHENCIISAVRDESGAVANYVTIMRDETEQLRLESIAAAMNSMDNLGYVFAGVRHEIGNPVNNAKMALSVLLHQLDGASQQSIEGYTKRALTEIGRVERLLQNLKSFNIHENMYVREVDLGPLLEELVALIRPDMERRSIIVTSTIGDGAGSCRADARALLQVLLNLVTNAVDALEESEDRRISLETVTEGASVRIRVRDTGCGIPEEQQRQLFRPFFTSKPNGTGLGLVIVRNMLAQMGASIEITSELGAGTVADILLQRGEDHAVTAPQDAVGHR